MKVKPLVPIPPPPPALKILLFKDEPSCADDDDDDDDDVSLSPLLEASVFTVFDVVPVVSGVEDIVLENLVPDIETPEC